ncbi:MAG: serine/threonine protein phosphatase [Candidatus Cloacimonetes bacterium]|nr:serine/threonine protein phosphatase [Candidatus Cloacimonadota bacterium]MBL7085928.1 serine/threonine protein phosphatase [Candidatus Cloacimonadota bacterium]
MLKLLMKKIQPEITDKFVFLGDYIDRGLQSKEVIDFLIKFSNKFNSIFLRGNHEDMLLAFLGLDEKAMYAEAYKNNGGDFTAISYAGENAILEDLKHSIPETHIKFFKGLKYYYIEDIFLFVHAGIIPGLPVEEQKLETLLWIREQFLYYPTGIDKVVVFGHTPLNKVLIDNDKIGLDTGAGYDIALSAVELHTKEIFTVSWKEIG